MRYLFNAVYVVLFLAAVPWIAFRGLTQNKYRHGWSQKLWGRVPAPASTQPLVWFHAVSVGEVNALVPVIQAWKQRHPDWQVAVSTSTDTGQATARERFPQATVFYLPLDFSWAVGRAFRTLEPRLFVLTELEIWPNLLRAAAEQQIPVAIINGRLSERSFRGYRRVSRLVAGWLRHCRLIACQSPTYAQRFLRLGAAADSVLVTGSVKYDGAATSKDPNTVTAQLRLAGFEPGCRVLLAGSTHAGEEAQVLAAYQKLQADLPDLRLVLVPRHPHRAAEVAALLDAAKVAWRRRSNSTGADQPLVLLVDTVGELSKWWQIADVGFVGGSWTARGGQNMIEPAGLGVATCFGPNTWNFKDAVQLMLEQQAAQVVLNETELEQFVRRVFSNETFRRQLADRARQLVQSQQGATLKTVEQLERLLPATGTALQGMHSRTAALAKRT